MSLSKRTKNYVIQDLSELIERSRGKENSIFLEELAYYLKSSGLGLAYNLTVGFNEQMKENFLLVGEYVGEKPYQNVWAASWDKIVPFWSANWNGDIIPMEMQKDFEPPVERRELFRCG